MSKYKIPQLPTIHIEKTHRFDIYFCAGLKNSHCTRMNIIQKTYYSNSKKEKLFSHKLYQPSTSNLTDHVHQIQPYGFLVLNYI